MGFFRRKSSPMCVGSRFTGKVRGDCPMLCCLMSLRSFSVVTPVFSLGFALLKSERAFWRRSKRGTISRFLWTNSPAAMTGEKGECLFLRSVPPSLSFCLRRHCSRSDNLERKSDPPEADTVLGSLSLGYLIRFLMCCQEMFYENVKM